MKTGETPRRRILLNRNTPEGHRAGFMDLRIAYDPTGAVPVISVTSADGAIEFRGLDEIRVATGALLLGAGMAERFRPPLIQAWPHHAA